MTAISKMNNFSPLQKLANHERNRVKQSSFTVDDSAIEQLDEVDEDSDEVKTANKA